MSYAALLRAAQARFADSYGRPPTHGAVAPGRVNLMGDHTDYSGGLAMPCAIDLYTIAVAAAAPPGAQESRVISGQDDALELTLPRRAEGKPKGDWGDYLRGVRSGYAHAGLDMPPLDVMILSNLPLGAGLSSSASLECCFASLLEAVKGESLDTRARALLCQRAEHDFAGVPCGILDQFAISYAREDHAMVLDCRDQTVEQTPLPGGARFFVIDSAVKHALADGGYAARRAEVHAAEAALGCALRDAEPEAVESLRDPVLRRRARHVASENRRVTTFATALAGADWRRAGEIMAASHDSLAGDFATSCDEIDWLVGETVRRGAYGARMTGGGFGGSVICLAPEGAEHTLTELAGEAYHARFGRAGTVRRIRAVSGARGFSLPEDRS